jgi:hypothetical protein
MFHHLRFPRLFDYRVWSRLRQAQRPLASSMMDRLDQSLPFDTPKKKGVLVTRLQAAR